jgi:hypothetical protein
MKGAIRDEKGAGVLALVLVLLVVGGLILTPLLGLMSTGLMAGQVYEKKTDELYAADAGVEDAVSRMPGLNLSVGQSTNFTIPDVNDKNVAVNTTCVSNTTQGSGCNTTWTVIYKVVSTATADGSGTNVTAYVKGTSVSQNYSGLLDQVITSLGAITTNGNPDIIPPIGSNQTHAPVQYYDPSLWPSADMLSTFYWNQVQGKNNYASPIDLAGLSKNLTAGYVNGPLTIRNSGDSANLTLYGTLFINDATNGISSINGGGEQKLIYLNLNGQTIFVASNSTGNGQQALQIDQQCAISGPGVIIAIGDVYFAPMGDAGTDAAPVFIFSVSGETYLKPGGDFCGSVAGDVTVEVWSGGKKQSISYPTGGFGDLNFPTGRQYPNFTYSITSWEINPL